MSTVFFANIGKTKNLEKEQTHQRKVVFENEEDT